MRLVDRLHEPGTLESSLLMSADPAETARYAAAGLDFVTVDGEHGDFTPDSLRACVDALKAVPMDVVVRPPTGSAEDVAAAAAVGADGLLVPHVETPEQAGAVVRAAHGAGAAAIVIVESALGVENAAAIAAVEGLDGIMIGPSDLSSDLGVAGQLDHPMVRDGIEHVAGCARAARVKASLWREPRTDAERDWLLVYRAVEE
jgi:2-keto-3-deoxy-L-rhamnonate aldolase RhmA